MGAPDLYQENGSDYPDNAERFIFFSKAAAHLALHLPWRPEVLHVHDWQASPAALAASAPAETDGAGQHAGDLPDHS